MKFQRVIDLSSPRNVAIFSFTFICAVHAVYAFLFAVDVPMWDQWDAEAEWYKRMVDGNIDWPSLIAPHNEHRIAFTRLFNGALFSLAGGWSPILGIYAQIPLLALSVALLCRWLAQFADNRRLAAIWFTLLAFSLPYSWANILSAFQNQFYFMLLFALLGIYQAAMANSPLGLFAAVVLALLSPLTMAGGFGTVIVVWGMLLLRLFKEPKNWTLWLGILALSAGLILHTKGMVHVAGHTIYQAKNFGEFIAAFFKILGWPNTPIGFLAWSLIVVAIVRWFRGHTPLWSSISNLSGPQRLVLGLIAWYLTQAAATAYARTHADLMSSRYQQIFSLVIPITFIAWGAFDYAITRVRLVRWGYAIFALGLVIRTYKELPGAKKSVEDTRFAREAIVDAVQKNDFAALKAKDRDGMLGYFHAERIWEQVMAPQLKDKHRWLKGKMNQ